MRRPPRPKRGRRRTAYERIMRASRNGTGVHLTAFDVALLADDSERETVAEKALNHSELESCASCNGSGEAKNRGRCSVCKGFGRQEKTQWQT